MPTASSQSGKLDKDVAENISREMEKVLKAWRKKWPQVEEANKRFDEKFKLYRAAHPELFEAEDEE